MSKEGKSAGAVDRMNLRLPPEIFARVDKARALRPGFISRNTWIAEAIQEKLAREIRKVDLPKAALGS